MSRTAEDLAAEIRDEITSGQRVEGDKLPSITEYVEAGWGRGVAAQALAKLRAEGWVVSRHGSGYFVQKRFARILRPSPDRLAAHQWGSGQAIQDRDTGQRSRTVQVRVDEVPAPDFVAAEFEIAPGAPVLRRARSFEVDGRRVQLADSYLPVELARGTQIVYHDTGPGGVYARLAERGFGPTRFTERVIARAPRPEEEGRLDLRRSAPLVIQVTRVAWAEDRCVEVTRMVLDAEAYELAYSFPA